MTLKSKTSNQKNEVIDVVFQGVFSVVKKASKGSWTGTMTELTAALNKVLSKKQRTMLPGSPGALRVVVNKVVNRLRSRGVTVKFGRTPDHTRTRFVRFAR